MCIIKTSLKHKLFHANDVQLSEQNRRSEEIKKLETWSSQSKSRLTIKIL